MFYADLDSSQRFLPSAYHHLWAPFALDPLQVQKRCHNLQLSLHGPAFQLLSAASNELTKVGLNIFWELVQFEVRKTSLPHHLAGRPHRIWRRTWTYGTTGCRMQIDELLHYHRIPGIRHRVEIFSRGWVDEFALSQWCWKFLAKL